jgi:hypothetical protein
MQFGQPPRTTKETALFRSIVVQSIVKTLFVVFVPTASTLDRRYIFVYEVRDCPGGDPVQSVDSRKARARLTVKFRDRRSS